MTRPQWTYAWEPETTETQTLRGCTGEAPEDHIAASLGAFFAANGVFPKKGKPVPRTPIPIPCATSHKTLPWGRLWLLLSVLFWATSSSQLLAPKAFAWSVILLGGLSAAENLNQPKVY